MAAGDIDAEGRFTLTTREDGDGCVARTHPAAISAKEIIGTDRIRLLIPEKYSDFSTSDLTVTIDDPTDDLLIELSWEGGRPAVFSSAGDVDTSEL